VDRFPRRHADVFLLEKDRVAAELRNAHLERNARTERLLLENERDAFPLEQRRPLQVAVFDPPREREYG
jgi:hypothetical protein